MMPELARRVFREGIVTQLPTAGLEALEVALEEDSKAIIQGANTFPALFGWDYMPAECFCPVAYALSDGKGTPEQVFDLISSLAQACDKIMNEPASMRHFLNWLDAVPRDEMIAELLPEVRRVLACRRGPDGADMVQAMEK